jgi:phosphonate transport system ATP-binding protein
LADLAGRRADQLSGGQSQRVAIARTLMQQPLMVIADEPVASLDPRAGEEVMNLFADLMRREKVTVIFSSHNLEHALLYSERILALRGGALMLDASTDSLDTASLRGIYDQSDCRPEPAPATL